jgi:hypothetical protein
MVEAKLDYLPSIRTLLALDGAVKSIKIKLLPFTEEHFDRSKFKFYKKRMTIVMTTLILPDGTSYSAIDYLPQKSARSILNSLKRKYGRKVKIMKAF